MTIESGAGEASQFPDALYEAVGERVIHFN